MQSSRERLGLPWELPSALILSQHNDAEQRSGEILSDDGCIATKERIVLVGWLAVGSAAAHAALREIGRAAGSAHMINRALLAGKSFWQLVSSERPRGGAAASARSITAAGARARSASSTSRLYATVLEATTANSRGCNMKFHKKSAPARTSSAPPASAACKAGSRPVVVPWRRRWMAGPRATGQQMLINRPRRSTITPPTRKTVATLPISS